ncbi:MAG: hypothetical protein B7Z75_13105 [Acidocella sp. 20-57-95]|nr:MAG: hypothetical protein B7Z75_13105 [Acidocella sp. 20-57-95]OYV60039.1 MAG: hypothetical protein B7Z71_06915 [Acidocella sp. 21-58-7]
MHLSRRATLLGLTAIATTSRVKLALASAPTDQRFVVVLLRGALDGMSSVVPYGDANLASLRPELIPPAPGQPGGMYDLGGFYGLNPSLTGVYAMYQAGEVLPIHAVAGPYRTRSHFEAQDLLQLGTENTGITSGWLNRVLAELPSQTLPTLKGLSVGIGTPLLLQGPVKVGSYAPEHFATPSPDLYARIQALNANDPITGPAIGNGLRGQSFDASIMSDDPATGPGGAKGGGNFESLATKAGALLAADDGPRIAAFQLEGWDTHGNQVNGLKIPLAGLDAGLTALKSALGPSWNQTMVLVMTEFGRTAAMNGTKGTDHGTATAAFVLGGNINGGKVLGTWPGLGQGQLFENRDLAPTMDIRSVAKGALASHLGLDAQALARVFPGSMAAAPLLGLTRSV